jgi:hypothetical protein
MHPKHDLPVQLQCKQSQLQQLFLMLPLVSSDF